MVIIMDIIVIMVIIVTGMLLTLDINIVEEAVEEPEVQNN